MYKLVDTYHIANFRPSGIHTFAFWTRLVFPIDRMVDFGWYSMCILVLSIPTSQRVKQSLGPSLTLSSLFGKLVTLRPRANLIISRPTRRISIENSSETDIALNPVLASSIFGGETSFALAENLVHLLERAALRLGNLRNLLALLRIVGVGFCPWLTRKYTQATPMQVTMPKKICGGVSPCVINNWMWSMVLNLQMLRTGMFR
jgi:hypothetical protein